MRLFDTTLLVDFIRRREVARTIVKEAEDGGERCATTEVNAFEILMGAFAGGRLDETKLAELQKVLNALDVLTLDRAGALKAAEIAAKLRGQGRSIGALDTLIAGIALASGYDTIVTRDEAFRRVPGLRMQGY